MVKEQFTNEAIHIAICLILKDVALLVIKEM